MRISTMSSSSKPADKTSKTAEKPKTEDAQPHLGVLEEDDEFEEFAVQGAPSCQSLKNPC